MPDLRRLTSWGWKHMRETQTTTQRGGVGNGVRKAGWGTFGETESHD